MKPSSLALTFFPTHSSDIELVHLPLLLQHSLKLRQLMPYLVLFQKQIKQQLRTILSDSKFKSQNIYAKLISKTVDTHVCLLSVIFTAQPDLNLVTTFKAVKMNFLTTFVSRIV